MSSDAPTASDDAAVSLQWRTLTSLVHLGRQARQASLARAPTSTHETTPQPPSPGVRGESPPNTAGPAVAPVDDLGISAILAEGEATLDAIRLDLDGPNAAASEKNGTDTVRPMEHPGDWPRPVRHRGTTAHTAQPDPALVAVEVEPGTRPGLWHAETDARGDVDTPPTVDIGLRCHPRLEGVGIRLCARVDRRTGCLRGLVVSTRGSSPQGIGEAPADAELAKRVHRYNLSCQTDSFRELQASLRRMVGGSWSFVCLPLLALPAAHHPGVADGRLRDEW